MTAADLTPSLLVGNKGTFSLYYTTAVPANIKLKLLIITCQPL